MRGRTLRSLAWVLLLCLATACSGRLRLPAGEGRVVDRESGAAIPGAMVVEWYRHAAPGGADVRRVAHSRATQCDAAGRFSFRARLAPGPALWLRRSYGPSYSVYHPDYGLQHAKAGPDLPLDRSRAAVAHDDLAAFCRRPGDDDGAQALAERACTNLTRSRN